MSLWCPWAWSSRAHLEKVRSATEWTVRTSRQVQLRHESKLTSEEYVKQKGWESARLERCPVHPEGGCGIARHTPYARVEPPGMYVARSYCAKGHVTISLLPDCLASRLSSTLAKVEEVATAVEEREGSSIEAVAKRLRPEIEVQGAVRWVRRRAVAVAVALVALKGLRPDVLTCVSPTLGEVRSALGVGAVLPALREIAGAQVVYVPPYVGLGPRVSFGKTKRRGIQQGKGADPP